MSYVFMKILERTPATYEEGIARLGRTDFQEVRSEIKQQIRPGQKVLDLGCGPGTLAVECAELGAEVVAVDINPDMIDFARGKALRAGVEDRIRFLECGITEIFDAGLASGLSERSFDVVVASLSLSELRDIEVRAGLNIAWRLLKDGGRLIIVDEVVPEKAFEKVKYYIRRFILGIVTLVVTRKKTAPLRDTERRLESYGFEVREILSFEGRSLKAFFAEKLGKRPGPVADVISYNAFQLFKDALGLVFAWLTSAYLPVPIRPGLYAIGSPSSDSPVLVTANYLYTFISVKRSLRGQDAYLLVVDTRGINVWCSAAKGNFSAQETANGITACRLNEIVDHHKLILPKLAAAGVNLSEVRRLTGWTARIGPVDIKDFKRYKQNGYRLTGRMGLVDFGLIARMKVAVPFTFFLLIGFTLPKLFFRGYPWGIPVAVLASGLLFPMLFYLLPPSQFFRKGFVLGLLMAAGVGLYLWQAGASPKVITQWAILLLGLNTFTGVDFSGMSAVSSYSEIRREFVVVIPLLAVFAVAYGLVTLLA